MSLTPPLQTELCDALVERIVAAIDADAGAGPSDRAWLGNLIEHARATLARTIAQSLAEDHWLYVRIPIDPVGGRRMLLQQIVPMVRDVQRTMPILGWWWLCKRDMRGAAIRLRLFVAPDASQRVAETIRLRLDGLGHAFTMPCYEPELLLFGGPHGMRAAHDFFCADSAFLAAWAEKQPADRGALIPEGLSVALTMRMLQAAGLDLFERWDVFDRVAGKRVAGSADDSRFARYEALARQIVAAGHDRVLQRFADEGDGAVAEHITFLDAFGRRLSGLYLDGFLECGLREFFVPIILFHWNRLLMPPYGHFGLSHAMAQELSRVVRQGASARE